jgi:hypothetical protein
MIAYNERGSDSEIFGARITEFGVVVEKTWSFEVLAAFLQNFGSQGHFWNYFFSNSRVLIVNFGLRVNFQKVQGLLFKIIEDL